MEKEELKNLFKKYHEGTCTEAEKSLLESWYLQYNEHEPDLTPRRIKAIGANIFRELPGNESEFIKIGYKLLVAAILIGATIAIATIFNSPSQHMQHLAKGNIQPGSNAAILTLGNGREINLARAKKGKLYELPGIQISEGTIGQIIYQATAENPISEIVYNKITIPTGGQWQVILPDGSKVWLNSSSSLSYPTTFHNQKKRTVRLTGEAYFEVAKDQQHPFIVKTNNEEVKVLGTHFNVSCYPNEAVKTTLLEGRVTVTAHAITKTITPGQETVLTGPLLLIREANVEEAIAWKNGYFRFNDEGIESIMRKLARWYDIEVSYEGEMPPDGLNGRISKFKNISQVLAGLEATKTVHFKINGRRVTVSSK